MVSFELEAYGEGLSQVSFEDGEGAAILEVLDVFHPMFGTLSCKLRPTYRRIGSLQDLVINSQSFESFFETARATSQSGIVVMGELHGKTEVLLDMFATAKQLGRHVVWGRR